MHVPQVFWDDALQIATYLMNHMPLRILGFKCPLKIQLCTFLGSSLLLKVFGCICYVNVPMSDCSKLDPKTLKCIFLTYAINQKGYKCYHPFTRRCIVFMNVTFHETVHFCSLCHPHLQEEHRHEGKDESAIPLPIHLYFFDVDEHSN